MGAIPDHAEAEWSGMLVSPTDSLPHSFRHIDLYETVMLDTNVCKIHRLNFLPSHT